MGQILARIRQENRFHRFVLFCILVLSIVLRLAFLSQPMRYDEAFTFLRFASKPLSEGLSTYTEPNNHLFHTLLVHLSTRLFGDQPWAIRLPALLAGIALAPITYVTTRIHYNADAGLLAAGLVASSSVLVEFSTNARGYTLVCCLFMALLGLAYSLRCQTRRRLWLLFALLSALGVYTVPTMFYGIGVVAIWILLSAYFDDSKARRLVPVYLALSLILAGCLSLLLYLPVIVVSGWCSLASNRWVQPLAWENLMPSLTALVRQIWLIWTRDLPIPVQGMLIAGLVVSLVFHRRIASYRTPVTLAAALAVTATVLICRLPGFPRTWLFVLPLSFMAASAGIIFIVQTALRVVGANWQFAPTMFAGLALVLCAVLAVSVLQNQSVLASEETGALPGAEAFTLLLTDRLQPGDGILALRPADAPLEYYFRLQGIPASYINMDLESKELLYVVVYESASTLAETLARADLSIEDYGPPERVRQIGNATLYLIARRG